MTDYYYQEPPVFDDRADAGRRLAEKLARYAGSQTVVLAVPRGGVPVAVEVAGRLGAALDIVVPRKIPVPGNPEAGYGAVAEDGSVILNEPLVARLGLTRDQIERQAEVVRREVGRRSEAYHRLLPASPVAGRTAIAIDDGLASGFTMLAAVKSLKRRRAARIVVAAPVASGTAYDLLKAEADDLVCLVIARRRYFAVASFYRRWHDLTEEEVIGYLEEWPRRARGD